MSGAEINESASFDDGEFDMAGITISEEKIEGWKTRLQAIERELLTLTDEKASIQRKLAAVAELEEGDKTAPTHISQHEPGSGESTDGLSLVDAIPLVARKLNRPLTPKEIKLGLPEVGYTQKMGTNYFYTALKRAVDKGGIIRTHDKKYVCPPQTTAGVAINGASMI